VSDLFDAWLRALPLDAPGTAAAEAGLDLLSRWSEPHRHYHTLDHLAAVLTVIDEHADRAPDPSAVRLAAWFHDAVYDPRRVDNEEASALLAEAKLPTLSVPAGTVAEVARLVRLTASHDPLPGDRNGELLSDADLAILAADPAAYLAYTQAIREEYAYLPDVTFATGRAGVLQALLGLPRLFHTPALRDRWQEPARRNLTRELASLRDAALPFRT
jgi:predicted metal-dependent HD superfamily phosphohydrolase